MKDDIELTDRIFTAWKDDNEEELQRLLQKVPEGYTVCVVNPAHHHPSIVMVRNDDIEASVAGLEIRLDGGTPRKRALVASDGGE